MCFYIMQDEINNIAVQSDSFEVIGRVENSHCDDVLQSLSLGSQSIAFYTRLSPSQFSWLDLVTKPSWETSAEMFAKKIVKGHLKMCFGKCKYLGFLIQALNVGRIKFGNNFANC